MRHGARVLPDPARGLAEFRRVLRSGSWAAASVDPTPERAFATRVDAVIGRHAPERGATAARNFSLATRDGSAPCSRRRVPRGRDLHRGPAVPLASFDACFAPIEEGHGRTGAARRTSAEVRHVVSEASSAVRRQRPTEGFEPDWLQEIPVVR